MIRRQLKKIFEVRIVVVLLFAGCVVCGAAYSRLTTKTAGSESQNKPALNLTANLKAGKAKYSEFPHSKHKQSCDSCHKFPSSNWKTVRKEDAAFPDITDYPKHESCLSCHRTQFYGSSKPVICSICHTAPSPRNSSRHPFPNPREIFDQSAKGKTAVSDFAIKFPHEIHVGIVAGTDRRKFADPLYINVGLKRAGEESCAICHQTYSPQGESEDEYFTKPPADLGDAFWLKKGTFKSSPIGHTTCFSCHSDDTGIMPAPSNCAACHSLKSEDGVFDFDPKMAAAMSITDKIALDAWRLRGSSGTFRHEWMSHAEMDCASCHDVSKINTLDPASKKVDILSCSICHITETADDGGILNYEVDERKKNSKFECAKCHVSFGKLPVPESHFKAIAAQAGN